MKERIVGVLSVTNFFQSISNIPNKNSEEDNETQDPEVVDNDVMKEIEQHVENDQYTLKDMKEHIEKNHIITNISLFYTYIFLLGYTK